jgi:putative flavoprotein involved in K+ transport
MRRLDTIVIGAGQAGLAMSRSLCELGVDHVVLERARVAERWRSERWDSSRLLSPNWLSRLPGFGYQGADPDGYMSAEEVAEYLSAYARSFVAPLRTDTNVLAVQPLASGYHVATDRGCWQARNVVIATGYCDTPFIPAVASELPARLLQLVPSRYRNPGRLPPGGVLVVGASASGLQLAREIHASGRAVTLAVGRHNRSPRQYRGKDIMWWLARMGVLDQRIEDMRDPAAARDQPSLQLVGDPGRGSLDLGMLHDQGIRLAGHLIGARGERVFFADDLARSMADADAKLERLLDRIDAFATSTGVACRADASRPLPSPRPQPLSALNLRAAGIETVLWATGFRRSYPWLKVPVLDEHGELRHEGGIVAAPGLYALGLRFMRRRKSSFIDGVGDDAREIAAHLYARRALERAAA